MKSIQIWFRNARILYKDFMQIELNNLESKYFVLNMRMNIIKIIFYKIIYLSIISTISHAMVALSHKSFNHIPWISYIMELHTFYFWSFSKFLQYSYMSDYPQLAVDEYG